MKKLILGVSILVLSGCASTASDQAKQIRDADQKMVADCQYLGDVYGSSGVGGINASIGMENAKIEAKEKAVKLNATHIDWSEVSGGMSPSAYGKAYNCGNETNHSK